MKTTKLEDNAIVMNCDALTGISRMEGKGYVFDYVFMDPPYNLEWEKRVLEALVNSTMIDEHTVIITEASLETSFDYLDDMGYQMVKDKTYKTNKHIFIEKK